MIWYHYSQGPPCWRQPRAGVTRSLSVSGVFLPVNACDRFNMSQLRQRRVWSQDPVWWHLVRCVTCQSVLWRLVLFKLGANYIAPMMQDLRVERHITWQPNIYDNPVSCGLILIDSLMWLGDLNLQLWEQDLLDLTRWRAAGLTAASFGLRLVWYAHWSRNTWLISLSVNLWTCDFFWILS
jgi:hypothetical protein